NTLSPIAIMPRGLFTLVNSVWVSMVPSWLQSTNRWMDPLPGSLPSEPCISTPTKTSPVDFTVSTAGLGVTSGPEKAVILRSSGQFIWADRELDSVTIDESAACLGVHGGGVSRWQFCKNITASTAKTIRRIIIFTVNKTVGIRKKHRYPKGFKSFLRHK